MPLQRHQVMGFLVQQTFLELPHQLLAFLDARGTTLFLVKVVEYLVLVEAVVRRVPAARGELVQVEVWFHGIAALKIHGDVELTFAERRVVSRRFDNLLLDGCPDLPPLVDHPHGERLVGHGNAAVREREREFLDSRFLEQLPGLGT